MMTERLKLLWTYAGYPSFAEFAREVGITEGAANKHSQRDRIPAKWAEKYINAAKVTGADVNWLLTGKGSAPKLQSAGALRANKVELVTREESRQFDSDPHETVPLWRLIREPGGTVHLEKTTNTVLSPLIQDMAKECFAVRVWDDSNAPWLKRGVTIFVDPTKIGSDGEWCLFAASLPDDERSLSNPRLAVLIKETTGGWKVQIGAGQKTLSFAEWPHAWKIIDFRP